MTTEVDDLSSEHTASRTLAQGTPKDSTEIRATILDIIKHIDNPYSHTGLGVKNEGYGKTSATDAIVELIESYASTKSEAARVMGAVEALENIAETFDNAWAATKDPDAKKVAGVIRKYAVQLTQSQEELRCLNCAKKIKTYPCAFCGVEPYDGHEYNNCYRTTKSGITLSHHNAAKIGMNCNTPNHKEKNDERRTN